jgi:hypothetical protein
VSNGFGVKLDTRRGTSGTGVSGCDRIRNCVSGDGGGGDDCDGACGCGKPKNKSGISRDTDDFGCDF